MLVLTQEQKDNIAIKIGQAILQRMYNKELITLEEYKVMKIEFAKEYLSKGA